jgi:hypothetical protein
MVDRLNHALDQRIEQTLHILRIAPSDELH